MESKSNIARPQFGNRFLTDPSKVFEHNAWDDVQWNETLEAEAMEKIAKNSSKLAALELVTKYEKEAGQFWDKFYQTHQDKFFKDRHWLFTEFPELLKANQLETTFSILEVGCGVGNTVIPLLEGNPSPNVHVYCCDFSETAINLVKEHPEVATNSNRCFPFICDITQENWTVPFEENSLDIVILIFVLSAIDPEIMPKVLSNIRQYLKPGGLILFRDYGRFDMAQLRFKNGSCLKENFYVRGDGTRVYFFEQEEVDKLFERHGFMKDSSLVDRRLQVNRGKQITMYRVWIQAKFRKS